jgi:hypothetical protein
LRTNIDSGSVGRRRAPNSFTIPSCRSIFYTGLDDWPSPKSIGEKMRAGSQFLPFIPRLSILHLNLPGASGEVLEAQGGYFGKLLRLVQQRRTRPPQFKAALQQSVAELEKLSAKERLRWLELLSYVHALVLHESQPQDREELVNAIIGSVGSDKNRRELLQMGKTAAEVLVEEGWEKGKIEGKIESRREALLLALKTRWGPTPPKVIRRIEKTGDLALLDAWIARAITSKTLDEVGFGNRP